MLKYFPAELNAKKTKELEDVDVNKLHQLSIFEVKRIENYDTNGIFAYLKNKLNIDVTLRPNENHHKNNVNKSIKRNRCLVTNDDSPPCNFEEFITRHILSDNRLINLNRNDLLNLEKEYNVNKELLTHNLSILKEMTSVTINNDNKSNEAIIDNSNKIPLKSERVEGFNLDHYSNNGTSNDDINKTKKKSKNISYKNAIFNQLKKDAYRNESLMNEETLINLIRPQRPKVDDANPSKIKEEPSTNHIVALKNRKKSKIYYVKEENILKNHNDIKNSLNIVCKKSKKDFLEENSNNNISYYSVENNYPKYKYRGFNPCKQVSNKKTLSQEIIIDNIENIYQKESKNVESLRNLSHDTNIKKDKIYDAAQSLIDNKIAVQKSTNSHDVFLCLSKLKSDKDNMNDSKMKVKKDDLNNDLKIELPKEKIVINEIRNNQNNVRNESKCTNNKNTLAVKFQPKTSNNFLSIPNNINNAQSLSQSFYSNCSSMSLAEYNKDMETYNSQVYCLENLDRMFFPTELDLLIKLNNNLAEGNNKLSSKFDRSCNDLKLRKAKLIYKTLLIYKDSETQQILSTINLDNCVAEIGSKYKLNHKSLPTSLWSLLLSNDNKQYIFYLDSQAERDTWYKKINDLSFEAINNYSISQTVYENPFKELKIQKAKRKSDGKYFAIKTYQKSKIISEDNETLKNVAINYNLSNTLKHDYLLYIEQKIENKDSINIGNYFIYILIFIQIF